MTESLFAMERHIDADDAASDDLETGEGWSCHEAPVPARTDDASERKTLICQLQQLRTRMVEAESRLPPALQGSSADHAVSARNLMHFLALRSHDMRPLQERLAEMGLSSLGRAEGHVLGNLERVLEVLQRMDGARPAPASRASLHLREGRAMLEANRDALLGAHPSGRDVRIMVTLPSDAADDPRVARDMVAAGMDIARINCAHDSAARWRQMVLNVRDAADAAHRSVRVLMDLGGPKIRTGPIEPGPAVLKLRPTRDVRGTVRAPAILCLLASGAAPRGDAGPTVQVEPRWLARLKVGDRIDFEDARGSRRRMKVILTGGSIVEAALEKTAYVSPQTRLKLHRGRGGRGDETGIEGITALPGRLRLHQGDRLQLTDGGVGREAVRDASGQCLQAASIACTLPEVLSQIRAGERVWFDDGKLGGIVRSSLPQSLDIEIVDAPEGGAWLRADKGINFPDAALDLPALTAKDLNDLQTVAAQADMVGLSFAQTPQDVRMLRAELERHAPDRDLGLVLKIETKRGFEALPAMLLEAMQSRAAGVMIARGDLAVECGFERMAEVQEEILWVCEAAHVPVIWATQVLESLAQTGQPSRAEITDAAMGGRAECVMLNKGPYIMAAIRALDDILRRMQEHQSKKRQLMRALKSWSDLTVL